MKEFLLKIINKIYNFVDSTTKDVFLHSYGSTLITNILFIIFLSFKLNPFISLGISFIITILMGLFKEYIIDLKLRKTKVEFKDIVADIIGSVIGTFINILMILVCQ